MKRLALLGIASWIAVFKWPHESLMFILVEYSVLGAVVLHGEVRRRRDFPRARVRT